MEGFRENDQSFATKALHAGQDPEQWSSMAVVPPISMSTTFKQYGPADFKQYEYGRSGNPTRDCLEAALAAVDGAQFAFTFSSGLAATSTITQLLKAGDHLIAMDDLYGGTNRYFRRVASNMGIETSFVDATDPQKVAAAIKPNTRMVWIETPTNPTLKVKENRENATVLFLNNFNLTKNSRLWTSKPLVTLPINTRTFLSLSTTLLNPPTFKDLWSWELTSPTTP